MLSFASDAPNAINLKHISISPKVVLSDRTSSHNPVTTSSLANASNHSHTQSCFLNSRNRVTLRESNETQPIFSFSYHVPCFSEFIMGNNGGFQ